MVSVKKWKRVARAIGRAFGCECRVIPGRTPDELALVVSWAGGYGAWTVTPALARCVYAGDAAAPFAEPFIRSALPARTISPAPSTQQIGFIPRSATLHARRGHRRKQGVCPVAVALFTGRDTDAARVRLPGPALRHLNRRTASYTVRELVELTAKEGQSSRAGGYGV